MYVSYINMKREDTHKFLIPDEIIKDLPKKGDYVLEHKMRESGRYQFRHVEYETYTDQIILDQRSILNHLKKSYLGYI